MFHNSSPPNTWVVVLVCKVGEDRVHFRFCLCLGSGKALNNQSHASVTTLAPSDCYNFLKVPRVFIFRSFSSLWSICSWAAAHGHTYDRSPPPPTRSFPCVTGYRHVSMDHAAAINQIHQDFLLQPFFQVRVSQQNEYNCLAFWPPALTHHMICLILHCLENYTLAASISRNLLMISSRN